MPVLRCSLSGGARAAGEGTTCSAHCTSNRCEADAVTTPSVDLRFGDNRDILRTLPDESVSAIICDPPYELAFMGKAWDSSGIAYDVDLWRECLRVAKPGAHLAAFGGTRTYHRVAVAVEDAGWEIRDSIGLTAWVQAQGFPKSKTQLKPAWEPIILARKPFKGSEVANVLEHGTGALNIDAARVGTEVRTNNAGGPSSLQRVSRVVEYGYRENLTTCVGEASTVTGRWPANVALVHSPDCVDGEPCIESCPVAEMDRQSGITKDGVAVQRNGGGQKIGGQGIYSGSAGLTRDDQGYGDSGGASRFFPTFKYQAKAPTAERPKIDGKGHPTVKPLALMRWLVRLLTPPGGLVVDPFVGTGTTLQAARDEGFPSLGAEADEFAYRLARQRLNLDAPPAVADEPLSLFDVLDGKAS